LSRLFPLRFPNPGLEDYVTFSNPYVSTAKDTAVTDISDDGTQIKREEITIYEFPVGTKLRLTDKAIRSGYTISNLLSSDGSEFSQTELTLSAASTRRTAYFANSASDPKGFRIYLRPVNTTVAFNDVKEGEFYHNAVQWAVKYGVTSGTSATTFSPNKTCTIAQIITFLWRANGCPEPFEDDGSSDIAQDSFYYDAVRWAKEYGLIEGTVFDPNAPCTRSMVVTYLWKLSGMPDAGSSKFTDVPADAAYAQAVAWAVERGITSGTSKTTFSPDSTCKRGQIVTFLYRAMGDSSSSEVTSTAPAEQSSSGQPHPNGGITLEEILKNRPDAWLDEDGMLHIPETIYVN